MRNRLRIDFLLAAFALNLLFGFYSGMQLTAAAAENRPGIEFETLKHDFGVLFQNEDHAYPFRFKNTGNRPLKIISAEGT
jgi:hypothetical protein